MLYKFLAEGGVGPYSGQAWKLPKNDKPGAWMPRLRGELIACERGYHLCREQDLPEWLAPELYEAEYEGDLVETENKVVVRKARLLRRVEAWNERTALLFAADCAAHVLHLFEVQYPDDQRPRLAIIAARQYALGEIDAAARAAAWAAAGAAARDAAGAAAGDAAWAAAGDAAWAAAWAAARDAAWAAARAAEQKWQLNRLHDYLRGDVEPYMPERPSAGVA